MIVRWPFGIIGAALAFCGSGSVADTSLRLSSRTLEAENADVRVTHTHDVRAVESRSSGGREEVVLDLNSTLKIVRKSDSSKVFDEPVMPLTALVNIDNGEYFVGLSNLKALSYEYNLLVFTEQGTVVGKALITPTSGHCRSVDATVTNAIRWFDEEAPQVRLRFAEDRVAEVIVENPYDTDAEGGRGECVIELGDDD